MDEFKPEDELKPDTSDRPTQRSRKRSAAPKAPVSRQHMMMGIGILVLLLLVIGIGSALNSPKEGGNQHAQQPATSGAQPGTPGSGGDKNIDLSGSSSMSGQSGTPAPDAANTSAANANSAAAQGQPATVSGPQAISAPPISSTPTQAQQTQTPPNQQRVELPGDLNSALTNQQGQVDAATQDSQNNGSSLPTAPATVAGGQASHPVVSQPAQPRHVPAHVNKPAAAHHRPESKPVAREGKPYEASPRHSLSETPKATAAHPSTSAPGGNYTLQLSSASRADSLNAWAKKQNLSGYHVYKTTRNGQPWFVLVSGSYATPAEAKRAVSSLPAEVRAGNPWVKPVSQVKKESQN
ncbi:SPOR domain-containing protein [Erwinia tasmaniensis]|uniref:SPOR domain-containing protein n=1 Tax=Erwinia tasmaniensis TaxID=338565 RepID=UPI003A4DDC55